MINSKIGMDAEGTGRGLIEDTTPAFVRRDREIQQEHRARFQVMNPRPPEHESEALTTRP